MSARYYVHRPRVRIHELKTHPAEYMQVEFGNKSGELRDDADRHFEVGDLLHLVEYDPEVRRYTGRSTVRRVVNVYRPKDGPLCGEVADELVLLSLERVAGVIQ